MSDSPKSKRVVALSLPAALVRRLDKASTGTHLHPADLIQLAVVGIVREFEATGQIVVRAQPDPYLHVDPQILRRLAELDLALELDVKNGHGAAQNLLSDFIDDVKAGSCDMITEGYLLDDPAATKAALDKLAAKWNAEDAMAVEAGEEVAP